MKRETGLIHRWERDGLGLKLVEEPEKGQRRAVAWIKPAAGAWSMEINNGRFCRLYPPKRTMLAAARDVQDEIRVDYECDRIRITVMDGKVVHEAWKDWLASPKAIETIPAAALAHASPTLTEPHDGAGELEAFSRADEEDDGPDGDGQFEDEDLDP